MLHSHADVEIGPGKGKWVASELALEHEMRCYHVTVY